MLRLQLFAVHLLSVYNRGHQRLLLHVKPAHLLRLELWTEIPKMCRSCVCFLCSVWVFFPLQLPFWFSKPASARLLYLRCLIFMYDSFAEKKKKKKRKKGNCSSSPSPPCFPYWFWSLVDVTPRQKCHLDESLLAQAGTAQHWWQKEEFHVDQINTDVK